MVINYRYRSFVRCRQLFPSFNHPFGSSFQLYFYKFLLIFCLLPFDLVFETDRWTKIECVDGMSKNGGWSEIFALCSPLQKELRGGSFQLNK
jgi:hypothetical protein